MRPVALLLSYACAALAMLALAGILRRGKVAASRTLPVYLLVLIAVRVPVWFWPERFYTWSYWLGTDLLEVVIRFALAVELLRLVFGRLPIGAARARALTLGVLLATFAAIMGAKKPAGSAASEIYYQATLLAAQATFAGGVLFVAMLALGLWYAVPIDPLHRDVAGGLALWTLLQAFPDELAMLDGALGLGRQALLRIVYLGMLLSWVLAAWRRSEAPQLSPPALRVLQPWRVA